MSSTKFNSAPQLFLHQILESSFCLWTCKSIFIFNKFDSQPHSNLARSFIIIILIIQSLSCEFRWFIDLIRVCCICLCFILSLAPLFFSLYLIQCTRVCAHASIHLLRLKSLITIWICSFFIKPIPALTISLCRYRESSSITLHKHF